MKPAPPVLVLLFALIFSPVRWLGAAGGDAPVELRLNPSTAHNIQVLEDAKGVYDLATTGGDPYVSTVPLTAPLNPAQHSVLSFEYFCPDGINDFTVHFGPPISAANSASAGALPKAETWVAASINLAEKNPANWKGRVTTFRLDPGTKAGVRLQLRNLQIRPPNAEERKGAQEVEAERAAKQAAARQLNEYLATDFPAQVGEVVVTPEEIKISGTLPAGGEYLLAEIALQEEPWRMKDFEGATSLEAGPGGSFSVTLPRRTDHGDRLLSRWAVVRRAAAGGLLELASHGVFPTDVSALAVQGSPWPEPDTKKGMGGVSEDDPLPELVELGVKHITVNVAIDSLIALDAPKNALAHEVDGKTWYFKRGPVARLDRTVEFGTQHGMVVSAIILAGFPADPELRRQLIHPESTSPGIYGMPNLTTAEGVQIYAAVLDFLARRYAAADGPHGLISNWIMHNEVDYAWTWSNMGEQPMELFMDTHVRSMRTAYLIARQANSHARVFLSLTHSWNKEGPEGRSYSPRALVDRLAEYSKAEGDFEWGLAYHPYPQSLFNADAWNDTVVKFSFDTPMITIKNIEVLDAYLRQPRMLYKGEKVRGVLLSEQGYNTKDYSEDAQKLQAAAFVYTWHKIRPLSTVEAFQNHRWIDHPKEGGLLLGLRTLPGADHPHGEKKLAWKVFQALDTPEEGVATAFAKTIIGVSDFSRIPYTGKIK